LDGQGDEIAEWRDAHSDMVGDEDSQVSTARRVFLYALFCRASAVFFED
jgi:hypothetical protein